MQGMWPLTQISGIYKRAGDYVRSHVAVHPGLSFTPSPTEASLHWIGSAQCDALNTKADRLSAKHPAGFVGADTRPILLVGRARSFADIRNWLQHYGQVTDSYDCIGEAVQDIESKSETWSYVLVQIDDFGGIDVVIDALLLLRRAAGNCPVILLSSETVSDDLSSERLVLCDATLRLPLSLTRFESGLVEAMFNNSTWQNRKRKLQPSDSAVSA